MNLTPYQYQCRPSMEGKRENREDRKEKTKGREGQNRAE